MDGARSLWSALWVCMVVGALSTAWTLSRAEWQRWWRWQRIFPKALLWPVLFVVATLCATLLIQGQAPLPIGFIGAASLAGAWWDLHRTIHRHLDREEARRQSEMNHWRRRVSVQQDLARQSLLKRQELAEVQSASLRHLMDPHFLFNALNGVMQDILNHRRDRAVSNLQAFSRLAIRQVNAGRGGWWSLTDEWMVLDDYVQLELRRIDRPLVFVLSPLPEHLRHLEIPAFMVQPLVENALWHGLGGTGASGPGEVAIDIHAHCDSDRLLEVRVRNTKQSTPCRSRTPHQSIRSPRRRHASDLIRNRLRLLDDSNRCTLTLHELDQATEARLVLPCRTGHTDMLEN